MPASTTRLASAVKTARRLLNSIIAVVALTAVVTTFAASALAHDATPTAAKPQGWSYPFSCCSGYDCRAVSQTSISERPEGYVIKGTGEVVGYSDARIKNSPDGEYHWCSVAGANDGKTICLFVPPSSF
ncbi:hypothetical protein [Mesorhizobium sp.]|jgi:hypothetical protein|uniref:hypothetical protein n=1 Tax=Mesorhizobium sp. TaxID=1871066 RepID=UPI000FE39357|nr:hypothetical protein [Mesorhizobium sp.]RWN99544.1 MAG: hypothetical protein EOS06_16520 [Mesorhizobium sp.]RWO54810.1 MAG: hypothetical protein EOS13_06530 [Mesorhizobium sp.]TIL28521.1 MAG: hypothetical protein E5Y85_32440 [Mesorhizobium sp.]TIL44975.1 MAG: hypothetical protein E5Y86_13890 [Mesorhizobium sp.]TIL54558.1 MAG: hypothetical protein E5Y83_03830 [Mesorhizobium sp.]